MDIVTTVMFLRDAYEPAITFWLKVHLAIEKRLSTLVVLASL